MRARLLDTESAVECRYVLRGHDVQAGIDTLLLALKDDAPGVRAAAARALGLLGPESRQALAQIVEAGRDEDARVRREVVRALGALYREGDKEAFAIVQHIRMSDTDAINRKVAREVDAQMLESPLYRLRQAIGNRELVDRIMGGDVAWDEALGLDLIEAAVFEARRGLDTDKIDAALILVQFGERGRAAALNLLRDTLLWGSEAVDRARAARVLGELGSMARALIEDLRDRATDDLERTDVREAARKAIDQIGG